MPFTMIQFLKWTSYIVAPGLSLTMLIIFAGRLGYKIRKLSYGGRGIRIFYSAQNGHITSEFVKIGAIYSDRLIEFNGKMFMYDKKKLKFLPRFIGPISREPFMWYTYDNISPRNIGDVKDKTEFDELVKTIKDIDKKAKEKKMNPEEKKKLIESIHLPIDPLDNFNIKTPEELYSVIKTKAISDCLKGEKSDLAKQAGAGILFIVLIAFVYLIGKKFGWW